MRWASVAACVLGLVSCKHADDAAEPSTALPPVSDSWCPEGFEAGAADTCFALPDHPTKDTAILVYVHGMVPAPGAVDEWNTVKVAVARGFAVVIPRGERGLCAWRSELKDSLCWPQEPDDARTMKRILAGWDRALWQVDALLDPGIHKRYVLAFANGGVFTSYVATHGLFPGNAYAIVDGAELAPPAKSKPSPILLVSAQDGSEASKSKALHTTLTKASWPHAFCPRPGPHTLTSDDVEVALRFFKREADGALKGSAYACDAARR